MPIWAARAGTKAPICARMAISAFWRRKVDLPAMLGPVSSQSRCAAPQIAVIGDEGARLLGAKRRLHHRMAPALDLEGGALIHHRAAVVALDGKLGQGRRRHRAGQARQPPRRSPRRRRLPAPPARRSSSSSRASALSAAVAMRRSSSPSSTVVKRTASAMVWRWMKPADLRQLLADGSPSTSMK